MAKHSRAWIYIINGLLILLMVRPRFVAACFDRFFIEIFLLNLVCILCADRHMQLFPIDELRTLAFTHASLIVVQASRLMLVASRRFSHRNIFRKQNSLLRIFSF